MYIVDIDNSSIPEEKIYKCGSVVKDHLIMKCNLPLFGITKSGRWCFARTQKLEECLRELPLYLKIIEMF